MLTGYIMTSEASKPTEMEKKEPLLVLLTKAQKRPLETNSKGETAKRIKTIDDSKPEVIELDDKEETKDEDKDGKDEKNTKADKPNSRSPSPKKPHMTMKEIHERKLQREKEIAERRAKREKEAADRKLRKQREMAERKEKREKEALERRIRKEKEAAEKKAKREKILEERRLKRELKEKEKQERKIKMENERKLKKAQQEAAKKKKIEEEAAKKKAEEERLKKHSITNFFHVQKPIKKKTMADLEKDTIPTESSSPSKPGEAARKDDRSDYERYFLPFFIKPHTVISKLHVDPSKSEKLDDFIKNGAQSDDSADLMSYFHGLCSGSIGGGLTNQHRHFKTAHDVAQKMNLGLIKESQDEFCQVRKIYLQFYENVKAPYFGTYSHSANSQLAQNPCTKLTPTETLKINYDYDSDLESSGEDEGEGTDIGNEDEDDDEEEDELSSWSSDIEGFVENDHKADDSSNTKRKILGPLKPEVRWLGESKQDDEFSQYFQSLRYQRIQVKVDYPIDPYFNYWKDEKPEGGEIAADITEGSNNSSHITNADRTQVHVLSGIMQVRKKIITKDEDLAALKKLVLKYKEFSLNTLTELIQKQSLSQYSLAVIKNSIRNVATYDKSENEWNIHQ